MQIDFHHGTTYVIARLAGFDHRQADVIAYCSQYVDDATNSGIIRFNVGAMYSRKSSAHKTIDYRNFSEMANHRVWIPFHFLPGNGGMPAGDNPDGTFIHKIVCRPGSHVARDMINDCIAERGRSYGLHRLGVTMHVFADTWAHQCFAGVCHKINNITLIDDNNQPDVSFEYRLKEFFGDVRDRIASSFVGDVMPLGHGASLSNPDKPYLKWQYRDSDGIKIERNNTDIFVQAADEMCKAMQRFQTGNPDANVPGLTVAQTDKIGRWFAEIKDEDGEKRHEKWLDLIGQGEFGFEPIKIQYEDKGIGSWKYQAIGTTREKDLENEMFPYSPDFLKSNWKLFHDALQAHQFTVIYNILPKYGICAA